MIRFSFALLFAVCIGMSACIALAEDNAAKGSTIRGEVIEALEENAPVEGATVKIINSDGKEFAVRTDAKGKYEFTGLPAGRYTINVYRRGYSPRIGKQKVVGMNSETFDRIKIRKRDDFETRFAEGLLQHVVEDIGRRYNLDASIVEKLHKSLFEALDTLLEQKNGEGAAFAEIEKDASIGFVLGMLTHPDFKPAFAKYLTETQIQDYINFTKEQRQQQVQQMIVQFITAFLDQTLSLTVDQRENMAKLLLHTINDKPELVLMNMFNPTMRKGTVNLLHNDLNISLESVLNQTQLKIWQELIKFSDEKDFIRVDLIKVEEIDALPDDGAENDKTDEDTPKSEMWILAETILKAHTEQLGPLNETASKRLNIATKGVIQQYTEMELSDIEDDFEFAAKISSLTQAFMLQNISREQAIEKLESMKEDLWGERGTNKRWDELYDITNHPLYQQAIKDVLSEDAYLQYKAHQAERENYRIQALRDLIVVWMDMIFLLNDVQQQQLKMTLAQLTIPMLNDEALTLMFTELLIKMDQDTLSPWQRSAFKGGR